MILVVDDDLDILETLEQALEVEGYEVAIAADGQAALDLIGSGMRPDLILLDLMMPVMNGWKFLEVVKEDPAYSAIPVVVSTAMSSKAETVSSAAAFLRKPLDLDPLLAFVRMYCGPPLHRKDQAG